MRDPNVCHTPLEFKNNLYILATSLKVPLKSDLILADLFILLRIDTCDPFIATEPAINMTADSDLDRIKCFECD